MVTLDDLKPAVAMILLQVVYAGLNLLSRFAILEGLDVRIYVVYRQAIGTLMLAPIAIILKRLEKVNFKSMRTDGKMIGTIVCISGAVAISFLRGAKLLNTVSPAHHNLSTFGAEHWIMGCLLLFASACCWSIWLVMQVQITRCHPDHISAATWICLFALLQYIVIALVTERDWSNRIWKPNMELVACVYSGVLASGLAFCLQAWCISIKGPVFSAMFNPPCTVIATVIACVFLHETLYVGSLAGAMAVILGL